MRQHPDHPQDQKYDEQRRPLVVPPEPPATRRTLEWLDSLVGGRPALLALTAHPGPVPLLREVVDAAADEHWLVVDELLGDLTDRLVSGELAGPLTSCLLLLRERDPHLVERTAPARIAGGVAWVVGKANGIFHPGGPVRQLDVARRLGLRDLQSSCGIVRGLVCRPGVFVGRPWHLSCVPELLATGQPELLAASLRADLVALRDRALADLAAADQVAPPTAGVW